MSQTGDEDFFVSFGSNADLWAQSIEKNLDNVQRKITATQALINRLDSKTAKIMANGGGPGSSLPPQRGPGSERGGKLGTAGEGYLSDTVARLQLAADHADANATSLAIAAKAIESIPGRVEKSIAGTLEKLLGSLSQIKQRAASETPDIVPGTAAGYRKKGTPGAVSFEVNDFLKELRKRAQEGGVYNAQNIRNITPQQIDQAGVDRIVNAINAQTTTLSKKLDGLTVRTRGGDDDPPTGGSGGGRGSGRASDSKGKKAEATLEKAAEGLADQVGEAELSVEALVKSVQLMKATINSLGTADEKRAAASKIEILEKAIEERLARDSAGRASARKLQREKEGITREEQSRRAKREYAQADAAKERISTAERDRRREQEALVNTAFRPDFLEASSGRGKNSIDAKTLEKIVAAYREAEIIVDRTGVKTKKQLAERIQAAAQEYAGTYGPEGFPGFESDPKKIKTYKATEVPEEIRSLVGDLEQEIAEAAAAMETLKKAGQGGAAIVRDAQAGTQASRGSFIAGGDPESFRGPIKGGNPQQGAGFSALEDISRRLREQQGRREALLAGQARIDPAGPRAEERLKSNQNAVASLDRSIKALEAEMEKATAAFRANETYSSAERAAALETVTTRPYRAADRANEALLNDPTYDPFDPKYDPKRIGYGSTEAEKTVAAANARRVREIRAYVASIDDDAQQYFGLTQSLEQARSRQAELRQQKLGLESAVAQGTGTIDDLKNEEALRNVDEEMDALAAQVSATERDLERFDKSLRQFVQSPIFRQGLEARRGSLVPKSFSRVDAEAQRYYAQEGAGEALARQAELRKQLEKGNAERARLEAQRADLETAPDYLNAYFERLPFSIGGGPYGAQPDKKDIFDAPSDVQDEYFRNERARAALYDEMERVNGELAENTKKFAGVRRELEILDRLLVKVATPKGGERDAIETQLEGQSSYERYLNAQRAGAAAGARRTDIRDLQLFRESYGQRLAGLAQSTEPASGDTLIKEFASKVGFGKGGFYASEDDPDRPGQKTVKPERVDKLNAAFNDLTRGIESYRRAQAEGGGAPDADAARLIDEAAADLTKAADLFLRRFAGVSRGLAPSFEEVTGGIAPSDPKAARDDALRQVYRRQVEADRQRTPTKGNRSTVFAYTQDQEALAGANRRLKDARERQTKIANELAAKEEELEQALADRTPAERAAFAAAEAQLQRVREQLRSVDNAALIGPKAKHSTDDQLNAARDALAAAESRRTIGGVDRVEALRRFLSKAPTRDSIALSSLAPGDGGGRSLDDLIELKLRQAKDPNSKRYNDTPDGVSLYDDIREHGIKKPITLQNPATVKPGEQQKIIDGHHRLAVARALGLDSVPAQYLTESGDARPLPPISLKDSAGRAEGLVAKLADGIEGPIHEATTGLTKAQADYKKTVAAEERAVRQVRTQIADAVRAKDGSPAPLEGVSDARSEAEQVRKRLLAQERDLLVKRASLLSGQSENSDSIKELRDLLGQRHSIIDKISSAREEGDLKENAGYHAAKDEQGRIEGRIRQLESELGATGLIGDFDKLSDRAGQSAGEVKRLEAELKAATSSLDKSSKAWQKRKKALEEERATLAGEGKYGAKEIKRLRDNAKPGNAAIYADVAERTRRINEIDAELKAGDAKKRATVETRALTGAEKDRVAAIKAEMAEIRKGPYTRAQRKAAFAEGDESTIAAIDTARKRLAELRSELKSLGVVRATRGAGRDRTPQELERQTRADELRARRQQVRDSGPYKRGERKAALAAGDESLAGEINDRINEIRRINAELKKLGFGGKVARAARVAGVDAGPGGGGDTDNERDVLIQSLNVLRAILTQLKSGLRVSGRASETDGGKSALDPNLPRTFAVSSSGEATQVPQSVIDATLDQQAKQAAKGKPAKGEREPGTTTAATTKSEAEEREAYRAAQALTRARKAVTSASLVEVEALRRLVDEEKQLTSASDKAAHQRLIAAQQEKALAAINKDLAGIDGNSRRAYGKTLLRDAQPDLKGAEFDSIAREVRAAAGPSLKSAGSESAGDFEQGFAEGMGLFGKSGFFKRVVASTGTFIVRNFTAGLVFGLTNYMQQVLTQAIQTEATFVRVSSALEATGTDMGNIRSDLAAISTDYGVALNDVYETAAGLAGLFTNAGDLASATRIVAQLQTISGGALNAQEAMGVLASTLSAFEALPGQDITDKLLPQGVEGMQKVADVLTVVQNNLGTNIETTAEGVSRMAGLARQMNLSFEQTAVFTAQIAKQTNQTGAAAGEQFSRILSSLQTGRGRGAVLEAYGQDSQVAADLARSDYGAVLEGLIGGWDGLSAAQQRNVAVSVAGQRQAAAFNALMNNGTKTLNILAKAQNANGDAADRMQKLMNTLNKRLDVFQTELQNLASNLVRTGVLNFLGLLLVGANAVLGTVNDLFNLFNKFADQNGFLGFLRDTVGLLLGAGIAIKAVQFGIAGLKGAVASSAIASGAQAGVNAQRAAVAANAVNRPRFSEFNGPRRAPLTRITGYGLDRTLGVAVDSTGRSLTSLGQRLNVVTKEVDGTAVATSRFRRSLGAGLTAVGGTTSNLALAGRGFFQGNLQETARIQRERAASLYDRAARTRETAERLRGYQTPSAIPRAAGLDARASALEREGRQAALASRNMSRLGSTMSTLSKVGAAADVALLALTIGIAAFIESSAENKERLATARSGAENLEKAAGNTKYSTTAASDIEEFRGIAAEAYAKEMREYDDQGFFGSRWSTLKASIDAGPKGLGKDFVDSFTNFFTGGEGTSFGLVDQRRKAGIDSAGGETQGLSVANNLVSGYKDALKKFDGLTGATVSQAILDEQQRYSEKIAAEARKVVEDESLSETQKQAAIANLESASSLIADMAEDQAAIASGIGQSVVLTSEQIRKVQETVQALQATGGRTQIGSIDLAPLYAELIKETGVQEGSDAYSILKQMASGSADSVDIAVGNIYLMQDEIKQLYVNWQSKLNQGLSDEADDVRGQLLSSLGQLAQTQEQAIQQIYDQANLLATQLRNTGDERGAAKVMEDAQRRVADLVAEQAADQVEMIDEINRTNNSILNFAERLGNLFGQEGWASGFANAMGALADARGDVDSFINDIPDDSLAGRWRDRLGLGSNNDVRSTASPDSIDRLPLNIGGAGGLQVGSPEYQATLVQNQPRIQQIQQAIQAQIEKQTRDLRVDAAKTKDPKEKARLEKIIARIKRDIINRVDAGLSIPGVSEQDAAELGDASVSLEEVAQADIEYYNAANSYTQTKSQTAAQAAQQAADIRAAQLGIGAAWANARGDNVQAARIQAQIARVQLAAAREQLKLAQASGIPADIAAAQIAVYNAQAGLIAANAAVDQAQQELIQSRFQVAIAVAEAAGHSVEAARRTLAAARQALAAALKKSGGKITAEVNAARVQAIQAEAALRDAKLQDSLDTINFNLEMGKITQASAIAALQEILRTQDLTRAQRRQLLLQIKGMKDELADSQWNFGDIKLPTPYQMRRYIAERRDQFASQLEAAAGTKGPIGAPQGPQGPRREGGDTITIENKFYIDGADVAKVRKIIREEVGGGGVGTRTTGARRR